MGFCGEMTNFRAGAWNKNEPGAVGKYLRNKKEWGHVTKDIRANIKDIVMGKAKTFWAIKWIMIVFNYKASIKWNTHESILI